jgi:glutaminyl-peptide cyclotransferase
MRFSCPKRLVAQSLLVALVFGCHEQTEETVTPVDITPSDDVVREPAAPELEQLTVRVVNKYPHSTEAFTQGLLWHEGVIYESTGRYGESSLRRVRLQDGQVLAERELDPEFFGEGLALAGDRLVQLTWRSGVAFVADVDTLEVRDSLRYPGEGWGLCFDGASLVMSDGSSLLEFRDPRTLDVLREVTVSNGDRNVYRLNELECVGDQVYANVWGSDDIVRIDSSTGRVNAVIDASGLLTASEAAGADVLNGIAYRPDTKTFLLTGKLWPHVFEVELIPR